MNGRRLWTFAVPLLLVNAAAAATPQAPLAWSPCESKERWQLGEGIPAEARGEFSAFLQGRSSTARSLAEAIAYRRNTPPGDGRAFSEYWIARTLFTAGLPHAAYSGFSALVLRKPAAADTLNVPLAALQCMNLLVTRHPALKLPDALAERLGAALASTRESRERAILWESSALLLKQQIEQERPREEIKRTVALLRGGGAYESFALGVFAALSGDQAGTAAEMERFLTAQNGIASKVLPLEKHVDQARLFAARAYYALGKHDAASRHLKSVRKSSNDLPDALSELAWSSLGARNYGEAIGASISLQAGGLRRVFAPEAPMVLAMAMNELCQYPESLRAVSQFRKDYEPSYKWLASWAQKPKTERDDLHQLAVAYLQKKKGAVPDRVASEWLRSPTFLAAQDELNLLLDEDTSVSRVSKGGSTEQKNLTRDLRRAANALIPRIREERARGFSAGLREDLQKLVTRVTHYRRLRAAGPVWQALAANYQATAVERRQAARAAISKDLAVRSARMFQKLEEIAENNRMIEVEIFDGAGQDIIWQNAHPDYKDLIAAIKAEKNEASSAKTWSWGRAPITSDSWTEIWEDELGSFQSNLSNNCSNKERYLAIKKSHIRLQKEKA